MDQTDHVVETVRGPVRVDQLGPALLHEHIFIVSPEGVINHNHTWDPTRIVIAHAGDSTDLDYLRHLADAGAMLGFDRFNTPFSSDDARVSSMHTANARRFLAG
jgi:predicted metal-dependent phosphotriesterase family hydrolase